MRIRYLLFGLLMFAFASDKIFAQGSNPLEARSTPTTIYFGLTFGYNKVMHNTSLRSFPNTQSKEQETLFPCPIFTDGKANGFHIGGFYEQFIGEVGTAHSIIFRGLYNTFPSNFEEFGDDQMSRVQDQNDGSWKEVPSSTIHINEIKYSALTLDVMYKFRAYSLQNVGKLVFTLGPTFDFIATKTRNQTMSIVKPDNAYFAEFDDPNTKYKFTNNGRTIVAYDGEIANAKSLRVGVKVGVQLEIPLPNTNIEIIPSAFYNMAFTNVDDQDWKVNVFQIGVDLRYALKF